VRLTPDLLMKNEGAADAQQLQPGLGPTPDTSPSNTPNGTQHVIAGLFAGIGGLERGLHRAGHRTGLLCENDEAAKAVLKARFPDIPQHDDVTTLDSLPEALR
jgi:hypothetical protein